MKIGVITRHDNDIVDILRINNIPIKIMDPENFTPLELEEVEAIAILGGTDKEPLVLHPKQRQLIENELKKGKRIFAEYCKSIGYVYLSGVKSTRYERMVYCSEENLIEGLDKGDMLEDQCNNRILPFGTAYNDNPPILQYTSANLHKKMKDTLGLKKEQEDKALWFDNPSNLLICSFRICNFIKARFSPKKKFREVVKFILEWLVGQRIDIDLIGDAYEIKYFDEGKSFELQVRQCIDNAMDWFYDAKIVLNDGKDGAIEGFSTEVYPDGIQKRNLTIRTDCIGEISLAYFLYYLLNGEEKYNNISENLLDFIFKYMQNKDDKHYGMIRWTQEAWEVCYQDDVARAIIPQLLKNFYTGDRDNLEGCIDALKFLVSTTGIDGTRLARTDNVNLSDEEIKRLSQTKGNLPSAHYNSYYHAALLIAYHLTKIEEFKHVGVLGLETIMSSYPETIREQSQTEELCRLIFPLSWLYYTTKKESHRQWLYKVTEDLQQFRHPSGAYLEWDEGYKATMRNTLGSGECSLLTENGDTVVDLLYSNNWLVIGWIQAYFVTGDNRFKHLWEDTSKFIIGSQIKSSNNYIDGAWARAFDPELMEVFGSPSDIGWGPWTIESGWSVAEITSGLIMGLLEDKLKVYYI